MTEALNPAGLLLLPRLRVQSANAVSSPLTWGFPAPSTFLGFVHALERRLFDRFGRHFAGVGIVSHRFEAQTFKPNRRQHLVFTQTRNPIYLKRDIAKFIAESTPAAIVEEGRAHFEVSLVIAVTEGFDEEAEEIAFAEAAHETVLGMRLAGGSILPPQRRHPWQKPPRAEWLPWPYAQSDHPKAFSRLRRRLLPGFALVHRPDVLGERLARLQAESPQTPVSVLDALLDLTRLNHKPVLPPTPGGDDDPGAAKTGAASATEDAKVEWQVESRPGWLVPLPIGYGGISPLYGPGEVANARDAGVPFRFVESLYSLGQWISPHRLTDLTQLLWHGEADPQDGLYRSVNRYAELAATVSQ